MIIRRVLKQKSFSSATNFNDFYRECRSQFQEKNYNDLVSGSQDDNIKKRAKNLYKDNTTLQKKFTEDGFIQAALDGVHNKETFAVLMFVKSDKKQNSAEECQYKFIKDKYDKILKEIKLLPKTGNGSMFIGGGKISSTKGNSTAKSIDIELVYEFKGKSLKYYGTLKHIDNQGGAQDNQFNDLLLTNGEFSKVSDPDIITLTLVSGTYFKTNKMNELSNYSSGANFPIKIDDLGKVLTTTILNWLSVNFPDETIEPKRIKDLKL